MSLLAYYCPFYRLWLITMSFPVGRPLISIMSMWHVPSSSKPFLEENSSANYYLPPYKSMVIVFTQIDSKGVLIEFVKVELLIKNQLN